MEKKIGVYVCHCGLNIAGTVDVEAVTEYASGLDSVVVARDYRYMCSDPGQDLIKEDIKEYGLNRVVVASCTPRMHEITFRNACQDAGLNPYLCEHISIREQCSWLSTDKERNTKKAKDIVKAAVRRVLLHEPLEVRFMPVTPAVLVVGGGIAGIQAALDIADGRKKVYLVERDPSIGGHMIQLDRTFPTLDCSECILTPKMTEVGHHPNIELLAYSEVEEVSGSIGNFKVKVRKKARHVDESKCIGCGVCEEKCPWKVPSEFEMGLGERGAVYIPFAQAVPNVATIDKREDRPCQAACKDACPIHMNTLGYISLITEGKFKEAYELIRRTNPLPAVCGRVCYAPCEDACNRGQLDEPVASRALKRFITEQIDVDSLEVPEISRNRKKVAIIGSGPAGLAAAHDLALLGYSVAIFEALPKPGGMLRYGIPDYRLPKDVLTKEIGYIKRLGVKIKTNTRVGAEVQLEKLRKSYAAIFIATGAHESLKLGIPGEDASEVIPGIDFLRSVNTGQKVEIGEQVAVIGGGNVAIDASRVARRLGAKVKVIYRRSRAEMPAMPSEVEAAEREGIDFEFLATPTKIAIENGKVSKMQCIRMELGAPDESGRRRPVPVKGSEFIVDVDAVIPAIGQASNLEFVEGLALEVSIWGTLTIDETTMATNIEGIFAGGDVVSGPAMAIDAIAAGKKAAASIDEYIKGEPLTSKEDKRTPTELSKREVATLKERFSSQNRVNAKELEAEARISCFKEVEQVYSVAEAQQEARRCLASQMEGCMGCGECEESCETKAIDFNQTDQFIEFEVGSIIVATGYDQLNPSVIPQYGYGKYDNVLTGLQFERMTCAAGPTYGRIQLKDGREPESVAIIHCVGSRDKNYHEYCSRVCCMYALKYAHLIKELLPTCQVYDFYIDMRCFGEGYEEFYERVAKEGVILNRGTVSEIYKEKEKLIVCAEDTFLSELIRVPVDMVILCAAIEPRADAADVAGRFTIGQRADGFFLETHPKLAPVNTPTDGVFIAGCCQGPRDIPDTVAQASGAAAKALSLISKGEVLVGAAIAHVDEERCLGCGRCEEICISHAPKVILKNGRVVSEVNEAVCKGCGTCAVVCPTGAMSVRHYKREQVLSMIEAFTEA